MFDDLFAAESFALIRMHDADAVLLLAGPRTDVATLADIPLVTGDEDSDVWDSLVLVPFAQAQERGFVVREDGTPLSVLSAQVRREVPIDELLSALPDDAIQFTDRGGFETTDAEYAELVRDVIQDEVGQGEGANLVISRKYRASVADWNHDRALSVFRQLLERERGAYWTFCIFTGDRYLIGASPERHVSVSGGEVQMNPISGTIPLAGLVTPEQREARLRDFLTDEKEIYELFMVVDEELKQMCQICHEGGQVLGPFLKPMSHLVHTEYRLIGRTREDVRQVLRDTMFAATVTGSPVENACRLIAQYEPHGRGYYASIAALIGRDSDGLPMADAPILIRTADVDLAGNVVVTAGATLVRDSDPEAETRETWAKASGILSAFGLVDAAPAVDDVKDIAADPALVSLLQSRNERLSEFWLTDQSGTAPTPQLAGRRAVVLDGEDDFVKMLGHIFSVMGMTTDVVRHDSYTPGSLAGYDLVVLGPGPGDPRDTSDPKIAAFDDAVQWLLSERQPFLAVCLGHQVLSRNLGFDLGYKDIVFQGTQSTLPVLGRDETVGFYNTFVARVPDSGLPEGLSVELDDASGDIHLVAGSHFRGIQFHAESILTQNGYDILRDLVTAVSD
ncbi:MAG TPA: chorismate-binding protein [Aeromicrobium sp.]|nr:chorismate-binding protein [Aeromicrobium sp.]